MDNVFTHTFDFEFKSVNVNGQVEFNPDGAMNMALEQVGIPITAETMAQLLELLAMVQKITEKGGEIKLLRIKKKEVVV